MAKKEHLDILNEGAEAWNKWRKDNPDVRPDLSGGRLNGTDLMEADLSGGKLFEANLSWANLTRANLSNTDLMWADLGRANLTESNLEDSTLVGANLTGANLNRANLYGANLESAFLQDTILSSVSLTDVKGLDTCQHFGPSVLDHRTLIKSEELPLSFLRGCGLPDLLIDQLPSLCETAEFRSSYLISHCFEDKEFAERLYGDLQEVGVRCWLEPEELKFQDSFRTKMEESLRMHDGLIVIISKFAVMGDWLEGEIRAVLRREREEGGNLLFPVCLDDTVMKLKTSWAVDVREEHDVVDFENWDEGQRYRKGFEQLLSELRKGK